MGLMRFFTKISKMFQYFIEYELLNFIVWVIFYTARDYVKNIVTRYNILVNFNCENILGN